MAKFVGGSKKTPTIVLNEPADLARWVKSVLDTLGTKRWRVNVEEHFGFVIDAGRAGRKTHGFILAVYTPDWVGFSVFHSDDTLVALAKRFQSKGWPEILAEAEKRAKGDPVKAKQINPENAIESRRPAIEHVTRALPAPKQAALPQPSKQLLLLPPEDQAPCCNWPGCTQAVSSKAWGCPEHWELLPGRFRERIAHTFRPGQSVPSAEYLTVMQSLRVWIRNEGDQ